MANDPIRSFDRDQLKVNIYSTREQTGQASAAEASRILKAALAEQDRAAVIFASAVSQDHFLAALRTDTSIDWKRVVAFHLDEYVGMDASHPESFRRYLKEHLFDYVNIGEFHGLQGEAQDLAAECARYTALLERERPVLVILGIGENGHLAFIDPPMCDFNDPATVRVVDLDDGCRMQQVNDGAFPDMESVPPRALSMTVPYFLRVPHAVITTGGPRKRNAVKRALDGPISEECPASALRRHPRATLFCDVVAAEDVQ